MAVTADNLVTLYPVFSDLACNQKALVDAKLDQARSMIDPTTWGDKADAGVLVLAAHLLAMEPCGVSAGLSDPKKPGTSIYKPTYDMFVSSVGIGVFVVN